VHSASVWRERVHELAVFDMRQRVLVLGSGELIGKRVVEQLALSDWATPIADHASDAAAATSNLTLIPRMDCTDERLLSRALAGASGVVNCVGGSARIIVDTARTLFELAGRQAQTSQMRIVHLSSMTVYGSAVGEVDESAPMRRDLSDYGSARVQAEEVAGRYGSVVILRPGVDYGPEEKHWSERIARLLLARRLGDLGALGDGYCNLVFIEDVVAAILQALRLPGIDGQRFNLGPPEPPTWNDYFTMYARALGAVPVKRISQRRLWIETKLLAPPLKMAEIITHRVGMAEHSPAPAIPSSLLRLCQQQLRLNVAKAESMLRLQWTPPQVGVSATAAWFSARQKKRA
jgi:nucleoside-diphosphate-sugar epimerase